jgi:hypothetical protein
VGNERFLFGKGYSILNGKDSILRAVLHSGEMASEQVAALALAMSNAGLHQLVQEFLLKNPAMNQPTLPGINLDNYPPFPEAVGSSPLNPNVFFYYPAHQTCCSCS